ncbi:MULTISPECIES: FtsH protease activity modulator HflK [unclassified Paenibacillus]|uniref:FtsH protease activity modulator HflK n=1 Tax=unclassified Paenibacillus TaxID=185978 RepID=UPI001C0FAA53|nr:MULTISPECIES: FtsH protease activity modulator HflK [unclassified Paenibacillus]MBU5444516.1 FtsH protease activity modulator HflK [Paenibacillus sp. MSJ-34]CAH0121805.1 Modulator of FtsH protease HflK [Paenibacillus sp. CECT 9249]
MEVINGGGKPSASKLPPIPKGVAKKIAIAIAIVAVLALGSTMFYTVQEQERAAVLTFGKFTSEERSGLHVKFPYPIQEVIKVPAEVTQRIHIGYTENAGGGATPNLEEALMITGDENIVSADAVVQWKIGSVEKYLYNIEDPEQFLRNATSAAIRSVIGSNKLDYAITDGKTVIQAQVKEKLVELNELYQTGIFIQDFIFQDIEPPEGEVQQAFKEVTNAREEKNTKINNARKYENDIIPKARGEAQAILENAEAVKKTRILNAQGDVAKFNAIYNEFAKNPNVTETRLILETLEKILPKAKIFITDGSGDTVKYLPLNELMKNSSGASGSKGDSNQ